MAGCIQTVKPIARGYRYSVTVRVTGDGIAFGENDQLRAEVRDYVGARTVAGQLSTEDGTIHVIDDETIQLDLPAALTDRLGNSVAVLDVVRAYGDGDVWLPLLIELPVTTAVTKAGDA